MTKYQLQELKGSVSALIGVGRSNIGLAKYLSKSGAKTFLCDKTLTEKEINLIIEENEYDEFVLKCPESKKYIRPLLGAVEFLHNKKRINQTIYPLNNIFYSSSTAFLGYLTLGA